MNIPCPGPWEATEASRFRLPGYGGAAIFMRGQIQPARSFDTAEPTFALDVMLLSPDYHAWYLSRRPDPGFVDRLSGFLIAAADDYHPENSVPTLQDTGLGLTLAVMSSTEGRVGLELSIVSDPGADVPDFDGLNFETSRATLAACAQSVRFLDGSWPTDDLLEGFGS